MILRKIELSHFGKFAEASIEFRRGLNLVVGGNEAGKTTLMEAIPAVLFGLRDKQRFRSWGRRGESFATLTLETSGSGSCVIRREMGSDQVHFTEMDLIYQVLGSFSGKVSPQGRSAERHVYLDKLGELFGVADEGVFRATLFFGQGALDFSGQQGLSDKLKCAIGGFGGDYDQVLRAMKEDYFALTCRNPWGKDKSRNRELEELQRQGDDILPRLEEQRRRVAEQRHWSSEAEALEMTVAQLRQVVDDAERCLAWQKELSHLTERHARLQGEIAHLDREAERIEALRLRQSRVLADLAAGGLPAEGGEVLRELDELRRGLEEQSRIASELKRPADSRLEQRPGNRWLWPGLALAVSVCGGLSLGMWPEFRLPVGAAALTTALLCLLMAYRRRVLVLAEKQAVAGHLRRLVQKLKAHEDHISELTRRLVGRGVPVAGLDQDGLTRFLADRSDAYRQLDEITGSLNVLPAPEVLNERRCGLAHQAALLAGRIKAGQGRNVLPEHLSTCGEDLEEALTALRQQLREKESRLAAHRARLETVTDAPAELQRLTEDAELIAERVALVERRARGLHLACDILEETVAEFREGLLELLSEDVAGRLAHVTSGKHEQVRFDASLQPELRIRQGSWKSLDRFSSGTRDAVYVLTRLALQERLLPGRQLPLFIDDALVNLDIRRQLNLLELLERLSEQHQVILLSHDQRLVARAARDRWHVITLKDRTEAFQSEEETHVGQLHLL